MFFSNAITVFLGCTLVSASPLKPSPIKARDAPTVLGDLQTLSSDVATLQSDGNSFTGTVSQGLALESSESDLNNKVQSTTTDINNSGNFDSSDSSSITNATNTLTPQIVNALNTLSSKASTISSSGETSTVHNDLQTLQSNMDALFAALISKLDSSDVSAIQGDQGTVDKAFNSTIATVGE